MKNVLIFSVLLVVMILSYNKQSSVMEYSETIQISKPIEKVTKTKAVKKKSQEITETKIEMTEEYKSLLAETKKELSSEIYEESIAHNVPLDSHSAK